MNFEIIIDASLIDLAIGDNDKPNNNKWLLSLVNDFEDGGWRYELFDNFIWDNIAETALSQQERKALLECPKSLLVAAAKNLRLTDAESDISKGSELAEIVLYGIMRYKYNALPVVPKIFYKQNVQDNAKGADSVHIVVTGDETFTLWFGEAKFYNSIDDARFYAIVQSVKNCLSTEKLKKENSIIVNLNELNEINIPDALRLKIKESLSNSNSIDRIKQLIHVPILLLHECEITAKATEKTQDYIRNIESYHKERAVAYFNKQESVLKDIFKYGEVTFHLILFPLPAKQPIVDKFVKDVTHFKG